MQSKQRINQLKQIAKEIRFAAMQMIVPHESHHIGCALGIVELLVWLYFELLKINPKHPKSPDRDIFILSKGHAASALYATLYRRGFFSKEILMSYDKDGGMLPEHATAVVPGVEISTGSLGHGLPIGIGFAKSFKNDRKNNKVYVLISDGELNEGSNWEAFMFAAHHRLDNLYVIIDRNGYQGYGNTKDIINLSPLSSKLKVFNWNVLEADGHDFTSLAKITQLIKGSSANKPTCIIAKTVKGKGVPAFEGKFESHYESLDEKTKQTILKELQEELH